MTSKQQRQKAEAFLALHEAPPILVLANAWDVVSARIFEMEGYRAIGTTSGGIAATLGYPDGERMSLTETLAVLRRIVEHVAVPVSADIEAGYADSPEGVADTTRAVLAAGAVGVNIEDGACSASGCLADLALQVEKIAAMREAADSVGVPLVINARTDVFLISQEDTARRIEETVRRAHAYRAAGADCIFVPDVSGLLDRAAMKTLVAEIDCPLNIIAGADSPRIDELEEIGIARVSFGPRPMRAALALVRQIARETLQSGTYTSMTADALTYDEVNHMFEPGV